MRDARIAPRMETLSRRALLFDLAILVGSWAFLGLLHPASKVFWLKFDWVVYHYLPMPLTLDGARDAIRWDATVLYPLRPRPVRAIESWLSIKAFGCSPYLYDAVNILAAGIAIWAVARIALRVTERRDSAAVVASALAVSYATGFFLIGQGFALGAAPAFLAVAAFFEAGARAGTGRIALIAAGVVMLGLAALSHDTFAALALVPLAWAVIVRRDRATVLSAIPFVAVPLAVGLLARSGMPVTNYTKQIWRIFSAIHTAPEVVAVYPARVVMTLLSGGIPVDSLRALPYFPAFTRIRDLLVTPAGILTIVVVVAPVIGLTALGIAARRGAFAGPRILFGVAWLAVGSLPLMLPIATPEAFHLTTALPGFFLLWTFAFAVQPRWRRAVAWALFGLFVVVHGGFRYVLFHRDLPAMEQVAMEEHVAKPSVHHHEEAEERPGDRATPSRLHREGECPEQEEARKRGGEMERFWCRDRQHQRKAADGEPRHAEQNARPRESAPAGGDAERRETDDGRHHHDDRQNPGRRDEEIADARERRKVRQRAERIDGNTAGKERHHDARRIHGDDLGCRVDRAENPPDLLGVVGDRHPGPGQQADR